MGLKSTREKSNYNHPKYQKQLSINPRISVWNHKPYLIFEGSFDSSKNWWKKNLNNKGALLELERESDIWMKDWDWIVDDKDGV